LISAAGRKYDLVVLDESQRIKNRTSTTAQVIRSIPRRRAWALTGTPIENSTDDLVNIFDFVAPGHLNCEMKPSRLRALAGDYLLRRRKEQVLSELPPKMCRDAAVELGPHQRESYRLAEEDGVLRLAEMGQSATIQHVFELILRLKQICNFDPASGESTKFERLCADLEELVASGQKAIIFSQWVDTLQTLAEWLVEYKPAEFHGRIPSAQRERVLHRFRHDPDCPLLLISYGAGGVGLNLQFASYVFLFDRWWNPAVEDQAINRAHRIGATSPVTVTRLVTKGTIEERISEVLEHKRAIFDSVLSGDDHQPKQDLGLSRDEIFGLFNLRCPDGARHAA
jgi:SNF2 family DNA or RNA helicase